MGTGNYISLYYHLVFSTKERKPSIHPDVEERLYAYLQACTKAGAYSVINVNGMTDHIHILLVAYSGEFVVSHFVREIKKSTNKFLNTEVGAHGSFAWQEGYFVSTVSRRDVVAVSSYIDRQKEHHGKLGFEKELTMIFGLDAAQDESYS
ncbi:MAG: IS200/IS605 family transposase [Bacteroidales bacterium]|nr:IS200/IS605 family transposase [Bacteroidales bacterium]